MADIRRYLAAEEDMLFAALNEEVRKPTLEDMALAEEKLGPLEGHERKFISEAEIRPAYFIGATVLGLTFAEAAPLYDDGFMYGRNIARPDRMPHRLGDYDLAALGRKRVKVGVHMMRSDRQELARYITYEGMDPFFRRNPVFGYMLGQDPAFDALMGLSAEESLLKPLVLPRDRLQQYNGSMIPAARLPGLLGDSYRLWAYSINTPGSAKIELP